MPWCQSWIRCLICTYEWVGVFEVGTPEECMECPSCGAQDSELLREEERDD
jgi:hypothetical protein